MYKLLIVDDEKVVIDGLVSAVDWEDYQVEIVGTALNGNAAYQLIEETEPDIVLADIRMPGLNGLDLIQKVKNILPDTVFIIISGYTEFDYAKRAIELEAVDYLTKPIEFDEIIQTVEKAINKYEKIQAEKNNNDKIQKYQVELEEKYILDSMLGRQLDSQKLAAEFKKCTVFVAGLKSLKWLTNLTSNGQDFIEHLKIPFVKRGYRAFIYLMEEYLVVVYANNQQNQESNAAMIEFSNILQHEVKDIPIIGISNTYGGLSNINKSYKEAIEAFHIGLYLNQSFTSYTDLEKMDQNVGTDMIEIIDHYFQKQDFDIYAITQIINDLLHYCTERMLTPVKSKYLCFKLINNVFEYVQKEFDLNVESILEEKYVIYKQLNQLRSLEEIREWLISKISKLLDYLNDNQMSYKDKLIFDVKDYLKDNYCKIISLDDVADLFHISPAYLSSVFSKKVGVTMFEYIINMRINKSKELLRTTNYKISEICDQVGYENQRYFNQVFKKHVGTTPGKYRSKHLIKQEVNTTLN
ncbi:response regulator [Bacillus taeanensis]|uniref:DNA-binding response regulator n=1 Tax=Bacillus taeanensis TaxID=273032 RepID=A0A366Y323_9BACI|nr:response regulator [Bacillus taeanensis]RBW70784.1 hypothetical protein DS031_04725 [Bacillus taeanensis]